jgi:flagellar hook-associated protein 1 FlgK
MSTDALGAALSGLRAAQAGLGVVSNNIANAGTVGYTAKSLPTQSMISGDVGMGVRTGEITRFVDRAIQRDYRAQLSINSYYSTRSSFLERALAFHGSADQGKNIGAKIGDVYQQFVKLSGSPDSATLQQGVVTSAQNMVKAFNDYSKLLNDMRNDAQSSLKTEVDALNQTLGQIADFNKRIQTLQRVGQSTAALEDQRDMLIKDVSKQLEISYYNDGDGTLILQTKGGQLLVDTEARHISFDASTISASSTYPDTLGGVILDGSSGTGSDVDLAAFNLGGKIGALLSMRDTELPGYGAQLDELAHKMAMRFNDQGVRLFTDQLGIVPPNTPGGYVGFAAQMKVNESIVADPSLLQRGTGGGPALNAGDNSVVMKIVNYAFGRYRDAAGTPNVAFSFSGVGPQNNISFSIIGDPNASIEQFARAMLDSQASDYTLVSAKAESESQYMSEVEKRLNDTSSVDTDQEMATMIELQKNYAASAKMINALDELFQTLLNAF